MVVTIQLWLLILICLLALPFAIYLVVLLARCCFWIAFWVSEKLRSLFDGGGDDNW